MKKEYFQLNSNNIKKLGFSPDIFKNSEHHLFFKHFLDALPFCVIVCKITGKGYPVLLVNDKMNKSLGIKVEDLIDNEVLDYFPPDVRKIRKRQADIVVKTKKPSLLVDKRNGRYFSSEYYPIFDDSGNVCCGVVIGRDITEEKRKEKQKLANKEEYYSSLIKNSMDLMIIINSNGKILFESPSLKKFLGYEKKDRIGKNFFENIHKDDIDSVKSKFEKLESEPGSTEKAVFRVKHKNGNWRYLECIANNQLDNKIIKGIVINSHDVTEETIAKEEILQAKNYYENIIDSTSEIIFTINKDLNVSLWNSAAENITGVKDSRIINRSLKELNIFENREEIIDYLKHVYNDKYIYLNEIIVNSIYGSRRLLSTSPSIVKNKEGEKTDVVFVCKDITIKDASHGRLLPGNSYLIGGNTNQDIIDIFNGLIKSGWKGLMITRSDYEYVIEELGNKIPEILLLSSSGKDAIKTIDGLEELKESINRFVVNNDKPIICLNRLDYLLVRFSFEELMQTLYKINDIVTKHNALFLIYANKNIFSHHQYLILEEEFNSLPSKQVKNIHLEDKLSDILDFIYKETRTNKIVYQKKIEKEFSISKLTTMRKLEELLDKGLVSYIKKGRMKSYSVTDKGRELLKNRYSL
jgi:PAS domain S-box-containing protein